MLSPTARHAPSHAPHPTRPGRRSVTLPLGIAALALLSGCAVQEWAGAADELISSLAPEDGSTSAPEATGPTASTGDPAAAAATLAALPRVERMPPHLPPYRRAAFGTSWSDVEGNGCNQRDDVLLRDALPGTAVIAPQGRCQHDVLAGAWIDPYSGVRIDLDDLKDRSQAQAVQIDHVVALSEAWRSGAWAWSDAERLDFANDLDVLVASHGPTNASKSDHDPAAWRPRKAHQCSYAQRWITVKADWGLGADDSERRALTVMLATCPAP